MVFTQSNKIWTLNCRHFSWKAGGRAGGGGEPADEACPWEVEDPPTAAVVRDVSRTRKVSTAGVAGNTSSDNEPTAAAVKPPPDNNVSELPLARANHTPLLKSASALPTTTTNAAERKALAAGPGGHRKSISEAPTESTAARGRDAGQPMDTNTTNNRQVAIDLMGI